MWLPAMPVYTSVIRQSAISSASSSTRWIDAIVASMLTTTPFFRPREGCVPSPMMLRPSSGVTSATIATIFDVPMSRPTIRFLRLSPSAHCPLRHRLSLGTLAHAFFAGSSGKPGTRAAKPFR